MAETLAREGFAAVLRPGAVELVPPRFLTSLDAATRQKEDPMPLDFGLQLSRFDVPGHPATTAATVAESVRRFADVVQAFSG